MFGLILDAERCLDGVHLVDGFFVPRSDRRETVRLTTTDLKDPVVVQFLNAGGDLASFLAKYSTGSLIPLTNEPQPFGHEEMVTVRQAAHRDLLYWAGSDDLAIEALKILSHPAIDLRATFNLHDGRPLMMLHCKHLFEFMKMEIAMVALHGAKFATCEHCHNAFLTGPLTGRRSHATYCSDRCRVAALRARNRAKEG